MAKLAAVASGPVGFTDANGTQLSIPTSRIQFEDGVATFTPPTGMTPATSTAIGEWINALVKEGIIVPGVQPPPVPAMIVSAKDAGSAGNEIQIAISNVRPKPTDASKTIFDAAVTQTLVYAMLTPATIKTVLGTAAGSGERPGPVFVSSATAPVQPKNGEYSLTPGATPADPATVDIPKTDGTAGAFGLTSKAAGADAGLTKVSITNADDVAHPGTFTLTAAWSKSAAGIEVSEIATTFGYELAVDPPTGGALAVPAPGTYVLSGGAEPKAASKARVTLPSGS